MSERLDRVGATKRTVPNARDGFWAQSGFFDNCQQGLRTCFRTASFVSNPTPFFLAPMARNTTSAAKNIQIAVVKGTSLIRAVHHERRGLLGRSWPRNSGTVDLLVPLPTL